MRYVYLIKRGERPEHHRAPYHPVILCSRKPVAEWEAGWTGDEATVWTHTWGSPASGWLLTRWRGLDVDYGHVVRGHELPDGTRSGFFHDRDEEPWTLLDGCVWWSSERIPEWLDDHGVIYPPDPHSQQRILDTEADDGWSGSGRRPIPEHWPEPAAKAVTP